MKLNTENIKVCIINYEYDVKKINKSIKMYIVFRSSVGRGGRGGGGLGKEMFDDAKMKICNFLPSIVQQAFTHRDHILEVISVHFGPTANLSRRISYVEWTYSLHTAYFN